jgi:hypothetical protein
MATSNTQMPQQEPDNGKANSAAYLPFRTFTSSLDALEHGIPKQIDRTIWRNQSGIVQSQILTAFRFLGFVDGSDHPTQLLHDYVEQKEQRKQTMVKVMKTAYADVIRHDLTKMTPKMLDDSFDTFGVSGDTKRKAVTFFLKAAKFADIPMHPLLAAQVRNTGPRSKRKAERKNGDDAPAAIKITTGTPSGVQASNTRSVLLKSGGTVTMTLIYDPFSLSLEDRQFVFELIDKLQQYSLQDSSGEESDEEEEG